MIIPLNFCVVLIQKITLVVITIIVVLLFILECFFIHLYSYIYSNKIIYRRPFLVTMLYIVYKNLNFKIAIFEVITYIMLQLLHGM